LSTPPEEAACAVSSVASKEVLMRVFIFAVFSVLVGAVPTAWSLDLDDPADLLDAYIKTVGDTSGKPVMVYAHSNIFAVMPGRKARHILSMHVVGSSRYEKIKGGYRRLLREVALYADPKTGQIIDAWDNPYVERSVKVYHVQNDPVNFNLMANNDSRRSRINYVDGGEHVIFYREVPLRYPSPLPANEYPLNSQGDWYEAVELFNSYVAKSDLENTDVTSAPETGSWSRIGPWLPWMEMGSRAGHLLYHGRSYKALNGAEDLPANVRAHVEAHYAKYLEPPSEWREPNETSWTYFKKVIDEARKFAAKER
jgi:hypothetical protein